MGIIGRALEGFIAGQRTSQSRQDLEFQRELRERAFALDKARYNLSVERFEFQKQMSKDNMTAKIEKSQQEARKKAIEDKINGYVKDRDDISRNVKIAKEENLAIKGYLARLMKKYKDEFGEYVYSIEKNPTTGQELPVVRYKEGNAVATYATEELQGKLQQLAANENIIIDGNAALLNISKSLYEKTGDPNYKNAMITNSRPNVFNGIYNKLNNVKTRAEADDLYNKMLLAEQNEPYFTTNQTTMLKNLYEYKMSMLPEKAEQPKQEPKKQIPGTGEIKYKRLKNYNTVYSGEDDKTKLELGDTSNKEAFLDWWKTAKPEDVEIPKKEVSRQPAPQAQQSQEVPAPKPKRKRQKNQRIIVDR